VSGRGASDGVWRFVREHPDAWKQERLLIVALDAQEGVIGIGEVPPGALTAVRVRELFKELPFSRVEALIGLHNRPGVPRRSSARDEVLTKQLKSVATELGVPLLDHVTFCQGRYHSLLDGRRLS
jgi:DNA repair protein RadC